MDRSIKHYGIIGMRWGVRRTKAQLRRARGPDAPRKVTKEQYEAAKKKAIRSGDKSTVEKWKGHLTEAELREAVNRVDMTRKLSGVDESTFESGFSKVENVMNYIGRTTNMANTALNLYGLVAKVNNTFNSKKLPAIDGIDAEKKAAESVEKAAKDELQKVNRERTYAKYAQADKEAADKAAASERRANQKAQLTSLLSKGNYDKVLNDLDSYDDDIIVEVLDELNKKKSLKDRLS